MELAKCLGRAQLVQLSLLEVVYIIIRDGGEEPVYVFTTSTGMNIVIDRPPREPHQGVRWSESEFRERIIGGIAWRRVG